MKVKDKHKTYEIFKKKVLIYVEYVQKYLCLYLKLKSALRDLYS